MAPSQVQAANASWSGGGTDALWSNTANWNTSAVPGTGDTATFVGPAGAGGAVIDLGSGVTVGTINFSGSSVAPYTIGAGGPNAQSLTLTTNGNGGIGLTGGTTFAQTITINAAITVKNSQQWVPQQGNNPYIINGNVTANGAAGSTITVKINGRSFNFNGLLADQVGGAKLQIGGANANTATLSNNGNTFTGGLLTPNGTVSVSSISMIGTPSAAGAGGVIGFGDGFGGGTLVYTGSGNTTDRVLDLSAVDAYNGASIYQSGAGLLKFTAGWTATGKAGKTITLRGATAGTGEMAGKIIDSPSSATTTTAAGGASAGASTIIVSNAKAAAVGSYVTGTGIAAGTYVAANSSGTITLSSPVVSPGVGNSQSVTFSGNTSVTKNDSGTWTLSGTNTHTGLTTISQGALIVSSLNYVASGDLASHATGSNLGIPSDVYHGTIGIGSGANTAQLTYNGTGETTDRVINLAGTTGAITLDQSGPSGLLKFSSAFTATGAGAKTLKLQGSTAGSGEIAGSLVNGSGTTALIKNGTGTWTLSGSNSYAGTTVISGGLLQFAKEASLYNNSSGSWTKSNITVNSGATLGLSLGGPGGEFTTGDVTTLLTNLGATGGTVNNNGLRSGSTIGFNTANAIGGTFTIADNIANSTGTGGGAIRLRKLGSGVLTLTGSNTYTGGTTISEGTLNAGSAFALGASGNIVFDGGVLQYSSSSASQDWGARYKNSTAAIAIDTNSQTVNLGGAIDNSNSGGLVKLGGGRLVLSAANTYGGGTTISAGTLAVLSGGTVGSGNINITAGAVLDVLGYASGYNFAGTLTAGRTASYATDVNGSLNLSSGTINMPASSSAVLTISGSLGGGGTTWNYTPGSQIALGGALNLSGIDYIAPLSPMGTGTYTLFTTTLAGGVTTSVTAALAMSGTNGSIDASQRRSFIFGTSGGTAVTLTISGEAGNLYWTGAGSGVWYTGSSSTANWFNTTANSGAGSSDYFYGNDAVTFSDTGSSPQTVTLSGTVQPSSLIVTNTNTTYIFSGTGSIVGNIQLLKSGPGVLVINNSNSYAGGTSIMAGTLTAGAAYALGVTGTVSVSGGALNDGAANSLGAGALSIGGGTLNAQFAQSNASATLTSGVLNFAASSAISGVPLTVSGGSLDNTSGSAMTLGGSNGQTWIGGFTFLGSNPLNTGARAVTLGSPTTVIVNGSTLTIGGAISGNYGLTKDGPGALVLTTSNSYSGGTTLANGSLALNSSNALGSGTLAISGGSLDNTSGSSITLTANPQNWNADFAFLGSNSLNLGNGAVTMSASRTVTVNGANLTVGGAISGAGLSLTKAGPGMLTLTASNGYSGGTVVNGGTLQMGDGANGHDGSLATSGAAVASGAALAFNVSSIGQTVSYALSGSGSLAKIGPGTLTLNGMANTYSGGTTISGGTLMTGGNRSLGSGPVTLAGGALGVNIVNLPNDVTLSGGSIHAVGYAGFTGRLGGPGGLTKTGGGVLCLSGSSSYSGATTVSGGTLRLGSVPTVPSGITIMPLGDSITAGWTTGPTSATAGYRGPLYDYLTAAGSTIQYVGSNGGNTGTLPTSPLNETFHEGHAGYTSAQILSGLPGWLTAGSQPYHQLPKVILLMIGTNDAVLGVPLSTYTANVAQIIHDANQYDPGVQILLAETIPTNEGHNSTITSFNASLPAIVAAANAAGGNVSLVDLNTNYPANQFSDPVHPNLTAYYWMAGQWFNALVTTASASSSPATASLPANSATTVMVGATLDLNGVQTTLGPLSGGGNVFLGGGSSGSGGLTVNSSYDSTFSGSLSGSGELIKTGSGALILSGTNTFTGGTSVIAGTLVLASNTALPDGASLNIGSDSVLLFAPSQAVTAPVVGAMRDIVPVPEPGTLGLLLAAGTAAGMAVWRRKRSPSRRR